jgi:hypothetical protein
MVDDNWHPQVRASLRRKRMNLRVADRSNSKLRANHNVLATENKASGFSSGRLYAVVSDARRSSFRTVCIQSCAWTFVGDRKNGRRPAVPFGNRDRPAFEGRRSPRTEPAIRMRTAIITAFASPSMRLARNFVAATTSQEVEIRPCVRLHDTLHVKLLVAAFHGVHGWLPFFAPSI